MSTNKAKPIQVRNKGVRNVPASEIHPHDGNFRVHPDHQKTALKGLFGEIGFAGAVVCYEHRGKLYLIDGHMRTEEFGDQEIPVIVTDLSRKEADKLLMMYDRVGALAQLDQGMLDALAEGVSYKDHRLADELEVLTGKAEKETKDKKRTRKIDLGKAEHVCPSCGHEYD